ncbi:MAG: ester cyclase [Anaerolinea sp.]|nr:ester cyclase [Anaerolinea sp.]
MATQQENANRERVRNYIENVINAHDLTQFDNYIAADGIDYDAPPQLPQGPEGARMFFGMFFQGSSDAKNTIHELIAEGDKVVVISTISGTHDGNMMGMPATGKKFAVQLLEIVRMVNGKYQERWGGLDIGGLMMQLGAAQDPNAAANAEKYAQMVHTYIDGVNADSEEAIRAVFAPDFKDANSAQVTGLPPGADGVVVAHHMLNQSFNDLQFSVDDIIVEGDKVAIRVHAEGTHTGDFYGFPPTGKKVSWTAHRILRVKDGMFVEGTNEFDQVGILQQMGIIPSFAPPPNPEANKATIRRLYDEENKGNIGIVDELFSPDFVMHGDALNPLQKGLEPLKQGVIMSKEAFPDMLVTIEDMVASGDKVVARLRWTGTQTGPFMGMPGTGKKMSWTAIATNRFENGKIVERWFNSDVFGMLQQFGIIPSMGSDAGDGSAQGEAQQAPAAQAAPVEESPAEDIVPDSQLSKAEVEARNKEVVRTFYSCVFNEGNTELLKSIMVEEFDDHGEALFGSPHGRAVLQHGISMSAQNFPRRSVDINDMIADGEWVGVRGTMTMYHDSPWLGVEATGNELKWLGLSIFRVRNGKIVERYFNSDSLYILQQLGLYP